MTCDRISKECSFFQNIPGETDLIEDDPRRFCLRNSVRSPLTTSPSSSNTSSNNPISSSKILTQQPKILDIKTRRSKYSTYDRRREDRTRIISNNLHQRLWVGALQTIGFSLIILIIAFLTLSLCLHKPRVAAKHLVLHTFSCVFTNIRVMEECFA